MNGQNGVPADAAATAFNLTVATPSTGGHAVAWPSGTTMPGTSNLNWNANQDSANLVILQPGTNGQVSIYVLSSARVIIDLQGYYEQSTVSYTYAYNGDGLRTAKTGPASPDGRLTGSTKFVWNKSSTNALLLQETATANGAGNPDIIRYVYGPDGRPLEQLVNTNTSATAAPTVTYLHHDQQGSTVATTDSSGTVTGTWTYDPHGNQTASTGTQKRPNLAYTGEYADTETGFLYLRARYYDPRTGQFLTRDPLSSTTREAYGYVGNNPVNYVDPTGLCWGPDAICNVVNAGVSVATGGQADCLTNITCDQPNSSIGQQAADGFRDEHPEVAQGVVDFASGMLDFNPITMITDATGLSDTSQYANTCSGWYRGGQATMIAIDLWAAGGLNAARFRDSRLLGKSSALFGRGGKAGGGALNHTIVRIGWGWKGSAKAGQDVFRIGIGNRRWHIEIWEVGKALR